MIGKNCKLQEVSGNFGWACYLKATEHEVRDFSKVFKVAGNIFQSCAVIKSVSSCIPGAVRGQNTGAEFPAGNTPEPRYPKRPWFQRGGWKAGRDVKRGLVCKLERSREKGEWRESLHTGGAEVSKSQILGFWLSCHYLGTFPWALFLLSLPRWRQLLLCQLKQPRKCFQIAALCLALIMIKWNFFWCCMTILAQMGLLDD